MNRDAIKSFDSPKLEALVETLFLAADADGEFSADERAHFTKTIETLTNGRIDEATLSDLVAKLEKQLESGGRPARLEAVRGALEGATERRIAFTLAVEMTAADGIIRTSERELIMEIADALEIERTAAADIVKGFEPV